MQSRDWVDFNTVAFVITSHRNGARQHESHKVECGLEREDTDGVDRPSRTAFIKINLGLKLLIKLTSERTLMG